jgi:hypothetical protein
MIIHIQTLIQAAFGEVDDNGNLRGQKPFQVTVREFSQEAFAEALEKLKVERDKVVEADEKGRAEREELVTSTGAGVGGR